MPVSYTHLPLVVEGCKNVEKDAELLPKVAEALQGRNVLILSEKEENSAKEHQSYDADKKLIFSIELDGKT